MPGIAQIPPEIRSSASLDVSRLADSGHLIRIAHGVYMVAGAPGGEFDDLRAAWLHRTQTSG